MTINHYYEADYILANQERSLNPIRSLPRYTHRKHPLALTTKYQGMLVVNGKNLSITQLPVLSRIPKPF